MKIAQLFETILAEQSGPITILDDIDTSKPISDYQVETPYDWILEYLIHSDSSVISNEYLEWRELPENRDGSVLKFFYTLVQRTERMKNPKPGIKFAARLEKIRRDLEELKDSLRSITMNADGSFDFKNQMRDLCLNHHTYETSEYFNSQVPKINSVAGNVDFVGRIDTELPAITPKFIGGELNLSTTSIKNLKDIHKKVKRINNVIYLSYSHIESHILGLLFIKDLSLVVWHDNHEVADIINKYLPEGDILDCQEELIDAGYEEYAQL